MLDLSADFDTVNYQILVSTLFEPGLSGTALLWFKSYFREWWFKVAWQGEESKHHFHSTEVPQGSVMGPLLFSIYTTSPGLIIRWHIFSYHCSADDTQLYLSFPPDDLTVSAWAQPASMTSQNGPTSPSVQHNISMQLSSASLSPTKSARNLGIMIDDQLTLTEHVASVIWLCHFALTPERSGLSGRICRTTPCIGTSHLLTLITVTLFLQGCQHTQ